MRWAAGVWAILVNLVTLVVAFGVVSKFSSPFERVVLSVLLILYANLEGFFALHGFAEIENAKTDRNRFLKLMAAVGSPEYDDEETEEQVRREDKVASGYRVTGTAQMVTAILLYLLAVVTLVAALTDWQQ